jgi:dihydrofolate reductase
VRKIKTNLGVSLDGFIAGPNGEIDWHLVDEEFNKTNIAFLDTIDTILFGRVTYQLLENYWATEVHYPPLSVSDQKIADQLNKASKIVFSRTLEKVEWRNSQLKKEIIPEEINALKSQPGKDICLGVGPEIISIFIKAGLIDEFRILMHPVILGDGKALFTKTFEKVHLKLAECKTFRSGVVLLRYLYKK